MSDNSIHCTIYPYAYVNGKYHNLQAFHFTEVKPVKKKRFVAQVQSADRYGTVAPVSERADASSPSGLFSYQIKWCDLEHSSALLQCENTTKLGLSMHPRKESQLKENTISVAVLLPRDLQTLMYGLVYSLGLNSYLYSQKQKIS